MARKPIKGRKGGGSNATTPVESPDSIQSTARAKILIALGEGEFAGGLDGTNIYLDGTPIKNSDVLVISLGLLGSIVPARRLRTTFKECQMSRMR